MESFGKYVSRRLAGFTGVILVVGMLNLLLFAGAFYGSLTRGYGENSPQNRLQETAAACSGLGLAPEMEEVLRQNGIWAMFLSPQGERLWAAGAPEQLAARYTVQEVAVFAKGYLAGYPVFVRSMEEGLLILGYPQGSYTKLVGNYWPVSMVQKLPVYGAAVLVGDLLLLFAAYFFSRQRILKSAGPLVEAVQAVAKGEQVDLQISGELAGLAGSLNRASRLLARQNEARANWISGVSHDIRTPLSMIVGYAGRIAADETAGPAVQEQARIVQKQGEVIKELVQDLNLVSRLEYEMQPLNKAPVRLAKLVRGYAADLLNAGLGEDYSLQVTVEPDAEQAVVEGDERLLLRAVSNLVQNSIRHNPAGCRIGLRLLCRGKSVCLIVQDDGVGISEETLRSLAEGARQAQSAGDGLAVRHGLGLRLVRKITEAHGGEMSLRSSPGGGCRVALSFALETA